mmetsp:Transcript_15113/g.44550  ORF Transcript_15113/g.44550 Transcript_15113/m.44550 type:complete len:341 (-) Transcript_15113:525-1547(-)
MPTCRRTISSYPGMPLYSSCPFFSTSFFDMPNALRATRCSGLCLRFCLASFLSMSIRSLKMSLMSSRLNLSSRTSRPSMNLRMNTSFFIGGGPFGSTSTDSVARLRSLGSCAAAAAAVANEGAAATAGADAGEGAITDACAANAAPPPVADRTGRSAPAAPAPAGAVNRGRSVLPPASVAPAPPGGATVVAAATVAAAGSPTALPFPLALRAPASSAVCAPVSAPRSTSSPPSPPTRASALPGCVQRGNGARSASASRACSMPVSTCPSKSCSVWSVDDAAALTPVASAAAPAPTGPAACRLPTSCCVPPAFLMAVQGRKTPTPCLQPARQKPSNVEPSA